MTLEEKKIENPEKAFCPGGTGGQVLAIASVPKQPWTAPTSLPLALERGTLFENLYFPFYAGGKPQ